MCLGCVCTKLFSNPYWHVMLADLYQVAALWFCHDSGILERVLALFLWLVLGGRNLWKGRKLIIDNIVTMVRVYFDVECQEVLSPGTDLKGHGVKKYSLGD